MRSPRTCLASRREPRPSTTSPSSFSAGTVPRRPRALSDDDLDPAVPWFGDLVRRRNEQLSLAASGRLDALLVAVRDHERADRAVGARKQDVEIVARDRFENGHLRTCPDEQGDQQPQRRTVHRPASTPPGWPVRTTNSVPRTPSMAAGVRTFIASGDCFAILPETAASVPRLSDDSNAPLSVVEWKARRSLETVLSGPIDSR